VRTSCGVEGIKVPEPKELVEKIKKASPHEDYMVDLIKKNTKEEVVREYRFDKRPRQKGLGIPRRWRFDAAIPSLRLAFECEGGTWSKGRHVNPAGYEKDLEKYNTAVEMGWSVYRFVPRMLNQGWIERILNEPRTN
jgi:hypothetical protein